MSTSNKSKFTIPSDLVEKAMQIREELQNKGKSSIGIGEIFESVIRQAFNKGAEVSVNKVWTFEKAFGAFKKSPEASILVEAINKEKLKAIWKFFEDRSKESETALEEIGTSNVDALALPTRKRGPRKTKQSSEQASSTGESTGESERRAAQSALYNGDLKTL